MKICQKNSLKNRVYYFCFFLIRTEKWFLSLLKLTRKEDKIHAWLEKQVSFSFIQFFSCQNLSFSPFFLWLLMSNTDHSHWHLKIFKNILVHNKTFKRSWKFEKKRKKIEIMKNQQKMYSMQKSYSYKEEKFKSSVKRSQTTSSIESNRGFKPTDRFDPSKKSFLVDLSKKIWNKSVWLITIYLKYLFVDLCSFLFLLKFFFLLLFLGWETWRKETDRFTKDFHTS